MKKKRKKRGNFPTKVTALSPQIRGGFWVDSHWNQRDFGVTLAGKHGEISSFLVGHRRTTLANAATTTVQNCHKNLLKMTCQSQLVLLLGLMIRSTFDDLGQEF